MSRTVGQVGSVLVGAAQVIAQFAPVPWLAPAVGVLTSLVTLIDQACANKNALDQLRERCIGFLDVIRQNGEGVSAADRRKLVADAKSTLESVVDLIKTWCSKNRVQLFIAQRTLTAVIQDCNNKIDTSLARLHLNIALGTTAWQSDFQNRAERDHKELLAYMSDIKNQVTINQTAMQLPETTGTTVMREMQEMLRSTDDSQGLGNNLHRLQKSMKKLLPNMHLEHGEIRKEGEPVQRTPFVDIWEGWYLNKEKVAIKMLRTVRSGSQSLQRFEREVDIWKKVWDVDQGNHILPLYGFFQDDGNFPYVVSPWPENGSASEYVERVPQADHTALIRGICAGICVLHTMNPMIIHGELRASNVVIDGAGNPLLANFGFSRILQDLSGVAISHTVGQDFARWTAPELSLEDGKLTTATDIYAFGMTMLELMTHDKPWASVPSSYQVIPKVISGQKPPRPTEPETIARGLNDHLWEVMLRCWERSERQRPDATELMRLLEGESNVPERSATSRAAGYFTRKRH